MGIQLCLIRGSTANLRTEFLDVIDGEDYTVWDSRHSGLIYVP